MDRFAESRVSYRTYPDTQMFLGRHNDKPNLGMERTPRAADFQLIVVLRRRSSRNRYPVLN
jgi:hypothetical protein